MKVSKRVIVEGVRVGELMGAAVVGTLLFEQILFPSLPNAIVAVVLLAAVVGLTITRDRLLSSRDVSDEEVDAAPANVQARYDDANAALTNLGAAMDQAHLALSDVRDLMIRQSGDLRTMANERGDLRGAAAHLAEIRRVAAQTPRERSIGGVLDQMRKDRSEAHVLPIPERAPWPLRRAPQDENPPVPAAAAG